MSPAEALGLALLHTLWQGALVALAAAVALGLLARATAATRHTVGMAFLTLMALAPLLTFVLLLGGSPAGGEVPLLGEATAAPRLLIRSVHAFSGFHVEWLPWVWAAGLGLMLARLAGGWWVVRGLLKQDHEPLPAPWLDRVEELATRMGLHRPFEVRLTETLGIPCSARAWRPVIWIPVSLLVNLPPAHVEAVLLHELAHVKRLDWIWNGLQSFIESLLFFHPGVWWLSRRVRIEREHACDDLAVALCGDAIALAEALATLEGLHSQPRMLALAANGGSLMNRIKRLLNPELPPRFPVRAALLTLICAGGVFAAVRLDARQTPKATPVVPVAPKVTPRPAGESQTITIVEDDGQRREYKTWIDRNGQVQESYSENGVSKPVDAKVHQWLADERKREAEEQKREAEEEARAQVEEAKAELESRRAELEAMKAREEALSRNLEAEQHRLGAQAARLSQEMALARAESAKLASEAAQLEEQAYERRQEALERRLDRIEESLETEDEDCAPPAPPKPPKPPVPPPPPKAPKAGHRTALPPPPAAPPAPPAPPVPPPPPKG